MAVTVPLPPPVPPMYLRFTISAAFSVFAFTLLPFFVVGLLLRCVFAPLTSIYNRLTISKHKRKSRKHNKAAAAAAAAKGSGAPVPNGTANGAANATGTVTGVSRTPSLRIPMPPPHTPAQLYASSNRLSPPSPMSTMSSTSTASSRSSKVSS